MIVWYCIVIPEFIHNMNKHKKNWEITEMSNQAPYTHTQQH